MAAHETTSTAGDAYQHYVRSTVADTIDDYDTIDDLTRDVLHDRPIGATEVWDVWGDLHCWRDEEAAAAFAAQLAAFDPDDVANGMADLTACARAAVQVVGKRIIDAAWPA